MTNVHPIPTGAMTCSNAATAMAAKVQRTILLEAWAVAGVRWLMSMRRVLLMLKHICMDMPNVNWRMRGMEMC